LNLDSHQFLTSIPVERSKQLCATGEVDDMKKLTQQAKLIMILENYSSGIQAAE